MCSDCKGSIESDFAGPSPIQAIFHPSLPCSVHQKAHTYRAFHLGSLAFWLPVDVRDSRHWQGIPGKEGDMSIVFPPSPMILAVFSGDNWISITTGTRRMMSQD